MRYCKTSNGKKINILFGCVMDVKNRTIILFWKSK